MDVTLVLFESSMPTRLGEFALVEPLASQVWVLFTVQSYSSVVKLLLNMRVDPSSIPCVQNLSGIMVKVLIRNNNKGKTT